MRNITLTQRIGLAIFVFSCLLFVAGCSVNWINETEALIPVVGAAASAFIGLLAAFGKNVPTNVLSAVSSWETQLQTDLETLKSLIAEYQSADPGTSQDSILTKIGVEANQIVQNFSTILPEFHIDDPATQAKVTAVANAILVQLQAIAAIIPVVQGAQKIQQVANAGKLAMNAQQFTAHFNQIVAHGTGDPTVDSVVAKATPLPVPQTKV